jgi:glutathione reductase (NADPH)
MPKYDYDLLVIGGGSGGVRAARMAAEFGARVGIVERDRFGGTCVLRGCVPKKLLSYAAHYREEFEDAAEFGWSMNHLELTWQKLAANMRQATQQLSDRYRDRLSLAGVDQLEGRATLVDAHTVSVDGRTVCAEYLLIATGSRPYLPDVPGVEHAITSDDAFELDVLPHHVLIVGGGYIAVEFASILQGLGAEVTLAYRGDQILRGFDDDLRRHLYHELVNKGILIRLNTDVEGIVRRDDGALIVRMKSDIPENFAGPAVMCATGRVPNTDGLGLAEIGVALDARGGVRVDADQRTNVASIYAVGDVTNRVALTPVAIREGAAVAISLFGRTHTRVDYDNIPTAVFCHPPVATVGLTETEAREKFDAVDTYQTRFRPLRHLVSERDAHSLIKLVVDRATQRVVGAHMVGADAPEIIQGMAIALRLGATKEDFDATIGLHPTSAEEFVTLREKSPPPPKFKR